VCTQGCFGVWGITDSLVNTTLWKSVAETVTIRRAVIETESIDLLNSGIICGVDLLYENSSITSKDLADLFAQTMDSDEPEALNVGFILGVVDTLLRARKTYPRG
jgi:hypothetical protein